MDLWAIPVLASIGLLVAHFTTPMTINESFENESGNEEDDPRDIPWIASWSPLDRLARKGQICSVTYMEDGPSSTIIQTVHKSCEAGMAHTRADNRIIIPDSIPLPHRDRTIRHEMFHIYQRRNLDAWRIFYQRAWSMQLVSTPPPNLPQSLKDSRRSNPDTWQNPWVVWQGRYWVIPIYQNATNPSLREAQTVWWDAWRQEVLFYPPASWTAFFGTPSQNEHPHELAAVYLTDEERTSEAGRRINDWWNTTGKALF